MILLGLPPELEPVMPHPDLVQAQRPTPAQVYDAAIHLGWLPEEPFLRPVVAAAACHCQEGRVDARPLHDHWAAGR